MNTVSPVGLYGGAGTASATPSLYETDRYGGASSILSGDAAGAFGTGATSAVTQIHAAVAEMLRGVGGGVENNKMLQMLIALMVLLALLEETEKAESAANDALAALNPRGGGGARSFVAYASSTTISVEYTSTTVMFGAADGYGAGDASQAAPQGEAVDLRA